MSPLTVVGRLEVFEDRLSSPSPRLIRLAFHALGLQRAEERFHHGIVIAISFPAHANLNAVVSKEC